ncbi:MAG: hypothetical protein CFE45_10870 [Burkholderiales bacterium PBB5]|nr:MAG: hypothetical protein CFE45_10870 [Burkholderiales bacterium PBB5]
MSKAVWWAGLAALLSVGQASAQTCPCGGTGTRVTALAALVAGKTVCAARGAERWQQYHSGSNVIDYKQGPTDKVDPSETVATFSVTTQPANITYNYGTGGTYTYAVCADSGSTYRFCSGSSATVTGATILSGQVRCP